MNAGSGQFPKTVPDFGAIDDGDVRVSDRLTTTLFLAALFHGIVILGVTFALPPADTRPTPTLEVLLLTGQGQGASENTDAQYLAQRNQEGTGTTDDHVRPANPASSELPIQQEGLTGGNSDQYLEEVTGERSTEFVSARSDQSDVTFRSGSDQPVQKAQTPLALSATMPSPIATNATDRTLRLRGRQDGKYEVIPDTRESKLAPYLDGWRRKIERLGTMNFPQVARQRKTMANPVLEVAIRADGRLEDIVVRKSSGRKEIDQAAMSILRLASPFDPFPAALRKQYDQLRFAYEWQFLDGESGGAASSPAAAAEPAAR